MKDLTGKRFGKLTVVRQDGYHYYPSSKRKPQWLCLCDCGKEITVVGSDLKNGHTQSCGCFRVAVATDKATTHGKSRSRLYRIWCAMKTRCLDPNSAAYSSYGGRGIKVCQEWQDNYESFQRWAVSNGYSDKRSIDRIDVNGNYEPDNCRWATNDMQSLNKQNTKYLTLNGETKPMKEWAEEKGLAYSCLQYRIAHGWPADRALLTPSKAHAGRRTA